MRCWATCAGSRACAPCSPGRARRGCRPCSTPIWVRARRWPASWRSPTMRCSRRPALREFAPAGTDDERLEHVLSLGPRHAGVTLGREGYPVARARRASGHVPAFAVSVTDTTGAGDAFHGAFALMLAEGRPSPTRARGSRGRRAQVHAPGLARRSADPRRARRLSRPPACPRELECSAYPPARYGRKATKLLLRHEICCAGLPFSWATRPRIERSAKSSICAQHTHFRVIHSYLVSMSSSPQIVI